MTVPSHWWSGDLWVLLVSAVCVSVLPKYDELVQLGLLYYWMSFALTECSQRHVHRAHIARHYRSIRNIFDFDFLLFDYDFDLMH